MNNIRRLLDVGLVLIACSETQLSLTPLDDPLMTTAAAVIYNRPPPPTSDSADCSAEGSCQVDSLVVELDEDGYRTLSWIAPSDTLLTGTEWMYYVNDGLQGPFYAANFYTTRETSVPPNGYALGCRDRLEIDNARRIYVVAGMVEKGAKSRKRFATKEFRGDRVKADSLP